MLVFSLERRDFNDGRYRTLSSPRCANEANGGVKRKGEGSERHAIKQVMENDRNKKKNEAGRSITSCKFSFYYRLPVRHRLPMT